MFSLTLDTDRQTIVFVGIAGAVEFFFMASKNGTIILLGCDAATQTTSAVSIEKLRARVV